jgi:hypothetical protein
MTAVGNEQLQVACIGYDEQTNHKNTLSILNSWSSEFIKLSVGRNLCKMNLPSIMADDREKWVPVTTTWRVLRLRMEERPPDMEGSCEYIE